MMGTALRRKGEGHKVDQCKQYPSEERLVLMFLRTINNATS